MEEIKHESAKAAAEAARNAAKEAFTKQIEELVHMLDVSEDEKNRLLDNDDMSFHSAISFAMNAAMTMTPLTSSTASECDFPVSVSLPVSLPVSPQDVSGEANADVPLDVGVMSSHLYTSS